jgi:hypothetical protein
MRSLIFSTIVVAAVSFGFYAFISSSIAASRDTKAATFSERFAAALPSGR